MLQNSLRLKEILITNKYNITNLRDYGILNFLNFHDGKH